MTKKIAKKKTVKNNKMDFESAITELEQLVEKMERGESSLEQSLQDFERGVELFRHCQKALDEAEQKVQILIQKSGSAALETFEDEQ